MRGGTRIAPVLCFGREVTRVLCTALGASAASAAGRGAILVTHVSALCAQSGWTPAANGCDTCDACVCIVCSERKSPVLWVRLDPGGEWLAASTVLQPEHMLAAELLQSRDVQAQV
jgi:hypothetical protein